jgi:nitroimidazol reductase NimA-like FMN-containing flavoprotein (pyridoxamine 5'-phosphate oxidase superfamily)
LRQLTQKEQKKLKKILKSVYFYSISTCSDNIPQSTMVQPALTENWKFLILSDKSTKKVRNIQQNDKVWLIADKTGMFKIPRSVYIKGTAKIFQATEENFNEVLSYHGWVTRRIFRSLAKDGIDNSVLLEVTPQKFITIGIFGKMNEQHSFSAPNL